MKIARRVSSSRTKFDATLKTLTTENSREAYSTATYDHYRHITGYDTTVRNPYPERRPLKLDRSMTKWRNWALPPNHYGVPPIPYQRLMGTKGSLFAKPHTNHSRVVIKPPPYRFYELPSEIERFFKRENLQKGIFLSSTLYGEGLGFRYTRLPISSRCPRSAPHNPLHDLQSRGLLEKSQ